MDKTDILLYNDSEVPFYPRTNASSIKTTTESTNGSFMTQQEIDDALWDSRITKGTVLGTINGTEFSYGDDIAINGGTGETSLNTPLQDINNKLKSVPITKDSYLKYNGSNYVWSTINSSSGSLKGLQIVDNSRKGYSYDGSTSTMLQFGSGITTKLSTNNNQQIIQVSVNSSSSGSDSGGSSSETFNNLTVNNDLTVNGKITASDIEATDINTTNIIATTANLTTINSTNINNTNNITTKNLKSNNITNTDTITTKNLEVTGSAHFFELVIDKVKAAGGAVLFTPCDGFSIDIVEAVTNGYKLYWRCRDADGNQRDNMWQQQDQALCQSFNSAKVGTSHDVSNKYYWSLVTEVSDTQNPVEKNGEYYHYIVISTTTCDGTVNPESGDDIVMLGYRGKDDDNRQSALYISAYSSLDSGLTAPLLAQYRGIDDFDLASHRASYFDAVGGKFVGDFEVEGQPVKDYIINNISGVTSGAPMIQDGYWYIWDSTTSSYKNSGIKASGDKGADADFYKIEPIYEYAIVSYEKGNNDQYTNQLYIGAKYIIYQQIGTNKIQVTPSNSEYHVQYYTNTWTDFSIDTTNNMCYLDTTITYPQDNPNYISIRLVNGNTIIEQRTIPITYKASAMLVIDQNLNSIKALVTDSKADIDALNTKYTSIEATANGINTEIKNYQANLNTLTGRVEAAETDITTINNTAKGIQSTVTNIKDEISGDNILEGQNGEGWSGYVKYQTNHKSFELIDTEYTQSTPINDYMNNNLFSFAMENKDIEISIYEFDQTYNPSNNYNIDCDFQNKEPCTIFDASTYTYTKEQMESKAFLDSNSLFKVVKDVPETYKVNDYLAITVTNVNIHNHIYGTIKEIDKDRKWLTLQYITTLVPARTVLGNPVSTKDISKENNVLEEITEEEQNNKLWYSKKLERYWIRFKEKTSSSKTFILRFRAVNCSNRVYPYMLMPMLEENVTRPHKYSQQSLVTQSMIKQTADEIKLSVNKTYLKIGDGNITLNGDTNINGSLTINNENDGFVLQGSSGNTEIMAKSIGDYETFSSKTSIVDNCFYSGCIDGFSTYLTGDYYAIYEKSFTRTLGSFKKDSIIQIQNYYLKLSWADSKLAAVADLAEFIIYENGEQKSVTTYNNKNTGSTIKYTVKNDSEVKVKFTFDVKHSIANNLYLPELIYTVNWNNILPTSKGYMLVGYDGIAANFGTGNSVYIGKDGLIANYTGENTNGELRINSQGVTKLNKRNVYTVDSSQGTQYYTVNSPIDCILCIGSGECNITLPYTPYEGQELKIFDKSDTCYLNSNKYRVVTADQNGDGTIYARVELKGKVPRTYTFINGKWYEEYTG